MPLLSVTITLPFRSGATRFDPLITRPKEQIDGAFNLRSIVIGCFEEMALE
jgi:hypothetical protein